MVCRYLMFPFVITNTLHNLQLGLALEECESYFRCSLFAGTTVIICAELMFLVRTYALWHRSKAALVIITINFIAFVVPMIVILALFDLNATMIPVSGITSCDDVSRSRIIVWAYVLLLIGETEILLSTMYQAVRYCREVGGRNRLLAILVQHNSFYFCCSLASSVIMISTMYFIPVPYIGLLAECVLFIMRAWGACLNPRRLQLPGSPTWDTSYSDAPFPVEFGPQDEVSIKSK
ncbi:hypothetical protein BDN67DRAFT_976431 [Paxillus ammoniavirescens]|nr:hypothetical protein BDN67DRAFT_976431 [Paxillus ammoniavirescens]